MVSTLVLAMAARGEEFHGYGPIPTRNFQPVQQIFLNMPFDRATVLAPGEVSLRIESAESNVIATNQVELDAVLKFEQNRTVLGATYGIADAWNVALDIPILSRFGGYLDPFIDSVEDAFGVFNVERKMYPNNSFGGFYLRRKNGQTLFEGPKEQGQLGDLWITVKHLAWRKEGWPLLALRAAVKAPTGSASRVFGSGKPDFGLGFVLEHQFLDWLLAYADFDVIYPVGPITDGNLTLNPMVVGGVAGEAYLGCGFSVVLQQNTYTSPIHGIGTRLLDGTAVELALGVNWRYGPLGLQLSGIDNISPVATAADFTMMLRMTWNLQLSRANEVDAATTQPNP